MTDRTLGTRYSVLSTPFVGALAGTAYLGAMWADNRLSSHPFNDLKLVGQVFSVKAPAWVVLGIAGHYSVSVLLAYLYANWARERLPGPDWLRASIFMQLENALLYPGGAALERLHAGIRKGEVPSLRSWKTFRGQVLRHAAFGLVLGYNIPTHNKRGARNAR